MKEIRLKKMVVRNFMGCEELEIDFKDTTTISGDNGTGKTTVSDAFYWCMFGKNSVGDTKFYIKNTNKVKLNELDHIVELFLAVDGEEVHLKKVYKEIHKHIKGSEKVEFTGHETEHYYNLAPISAGEYKKKIDAIIDEETFRAITDIHYFNKLDWKKQRVILEKIANIRTDEELAQGNEDFTKLLSALVGKNFNEYKAQLDKEKNLVMADLKLIPTKIKEASLQKKEVINLQDEEYLKTIKDKITVIQKEKDDITETNKVALEVINKQQLELSNLKNQLNTATNNRKNASGQDVIRLEGEISALVSKVENIKRQIKQINEDIITAAASTTKLDADNAKLREEYITINAEKAPEVDPADMNCPVCKNKLNEYQLDSKEKDLLESWNKNKINKLAAINEKGKANNEKIESIQKQITEDKEKLSVLTTSQETCQKEIDSKQIEKKKLEDSKKDDPSNEELELQEKINKFIVNDPPKVDFSQQDEKIKELQKQNDDCVNNIALIKANKDIDDRVEQLKKEETELAKKLNSYEKTLFVMFEFSKAKALEVEEAVNKLFKYVQIQMFEKQVNGDYAETCLVKYGGVPYQTVNTAGKINMGLDIINVLTKFYNVKCPVFIDNTESINNIIETDLQIIKLQVSHEHKLTIN